MKLKVGDDVKVLNYKLKNYIGLVGYICNIKYNKCFIGFYDNCEYIWNNLKSVKSHKFSDYEKVMPKKSHKIIHNRRLNYLWSKIWVRQQEERMKDYEMIFENGRVLFVKKGENNET